MSDEAKTVRTWVFDANGGSKVIDLASGEGPPEGWFFAPPPGVQIAGDDASPATPPTPPTMSERIDQLELRLMKLESQIDTALQTLAAMQKPPEQADQKARLLERARELGIDGVDGRTAEAKLKTLILEAEARKAEG